MMANISGEPEIIEANLSYKLEPLLGRFDSDTGWVELEISESRLQ